MEKNRKNPDSQVPTKLSAKQFHYERRSKQDTAQPSDKQPPTTDIFVNINETTPHNPFPIHVATGPVTIKTTGIDKIIVIIGIKKT